jgi:dGTPase
MLDPSRVRRSNLGRVADWDELYDEAAMARIVDEPAKRVPAPVRTPFERDRARVVHSASLRRLAAKTQVLDPQADDFVRNRLTHSLEVAQVARDIAHPLGCHPDIAETAALAHDLGHPPFGHNGEAVLDRLAADCGGFEGNAQTLRILTRLEAKSAAAGGRSVGLNLTRATLDACTKYPWRRVSTDVTGEGSTAEAGGKFGVYDDDWPVFAWLREGVPGARRCIEAQVMDFADDVAYSVHDLEDGIVGGKVDLSVLDSPAELAAVWETVRDWYLPEVEDEALEAALDRLRAVGTWPGATYDGSRRGLATLKNLTSDLIGVFCGHVHAATRDQFGEEPLVRHAADLVVPEGTVHEIAVLKGIAAHYVMRTPERHTIMERQREVIAELFAALVASDGQALDPTFRHDHAVAADDAARTRVVVDQIASLTDASAVAWHDRLTGRVR